MVEEKAGAAVRWMIIVPALLIVAGLGSSACSTDVCTTDQDCTSQHGSGWVCVVEAGVCLDRSSRDGGGGDDGGVPQTDAGSTADAGSDAGLTCSLQCGEGARCEGSQCVCDATSCPDGCCTDGACVPRNECGSCGECRWLAAGIVPNASGVSLLLDDGRVLVVGGGMSGPSTIGGAASNLVSIFDPSRNSWEQWPRMPTARQDHAAVELNSGSVLVCGGLVEIQGVATRLASCDLLSLETRTWSETSPMQSPRSHLTLVSHDGGRKAIAIGGMADNDDPMHYSREVEMFDSTTATWTVRAPMDVARSSPNAAAVDGSRYLVWGGNSAAAGETAIYNVTTNMWSTGPTMNDSRGGNAAFAQLLDGRLFVAGGSNSTDGLSASAEELAPSSPTWKSLKPMSVPRIAHQLVALPSNRGVVAIGGSKVKNRGGGFFMSDPIKDVELYNPASDTWITLPRLTRARHHFSAHVLRDGRILIFGNLSLFGSPDLSAEIYE